MTMTAFRKPPASADEFLAGASVANAKPHNAPRSAEKRLQVLMTDEELVALKRYALDHRMTVSDVVRKALSRYMS